jgi:hypothetical protein
MAGGALSAVSNWVGSWNFFGAAQSKPDIDLKNDKYDPTSEAQKTYIEKRILLFKVNCGAVKEDFRNLLATNAALFGAYELAPSLLSLPILIIGAPIDLYYSFVLVKDFIKAYPKHFAVLKELTEICAWMAKDQGVSVTKNETFQKLVDAIAPLVPLEKVVFWDLTKVKTSDVGKNYLASLTAPPHNQNYVGIFANEKPDSPDSLLLAEARFRHSSQLWAGVEYTIFGLGIEKPLQTAMQATEMVQQAHAAMRAVK